MQVLASFYCALPVTIQNTMCSLEGWRVKRQRFGFDFPSLLREVENHAFWSAEAICNYRDTRLREFIKHSFLTVPYYRRHFKALGVMPQDIKGVADLKHLPVLTKAEVQVNYQGLRSDAAATGRRFDITTSGTTGGGLLMMTTRHAIQEQWAVWWRYRRWHGLDFGVWCAYFGGRDIVPYRQTKPPFWRYNFAGKQIIFSQYHMNAANMPYYVEELKRQKPPWLHGYPSLLAALAGFMLDHDIDLGYQVRWVTAGAENLTPHQTMLIELAFHTKPRQHYGMEEAVANFSECEFGNLHVDEDFSGVEFLPCQDGPGYRVVGTNFTNYAFPLIRYDVQDVVSLAQEACPCGRPGRIVGGVDGRLEDHIILRNGARFGRMDWIFKDALNVREAQVHQQENGDIIIYIARGKSFSPDDELKLKSLLKEYIGSENRVRFEYVEQIQRTKNGKLRFVISEVDAGKIENS